MAQIDYKQARRRVALHAAAPELLAALKLTNDWLSMQREGKAPDWNVLAPVVAAAIKKAEQ